MKFNKRKHCFCKLLFIIALGLIPVLFFSVGQTKADNSKPLERVVLQLTWYHEFQFAGYYAAQQMGYYQEEGLEVEIRERSPDRLPVDAVLSGDADFGNATSDIMLLRMQGKPVVALAVIMQHSPWVLLVRADSGITVPEDLIGKTVSMDLSYRDVEIQAMFKNENISNENITIVKKEPGVENLINGTVDARVSYMTSQPFDLQKRGFEARVLRPLNYGIDFYGDILFTTERQILDHPQRVAAFRRASLRGWQYAMDHPEELIEYIYSTYYADTTQTAMQYTRDHFRFEAKVMAEDLIHPKLIQIGHMNPHRWRRIADTYAALGMAEQIDILKGFIYDPDPGPDYKWVRWTVGIVVAILLAVGIYATVLLVFNRRLRHVVQLRTSELSQTNQTLVQEASERKLAEESLQSSEERYRCLVEATTSIIWTTDGSGGFVVPQLSWEKYTGQPWNEHKDFGWTKKIHPDNVEDILKGWKKAIQKISPYETCGRIWSANLKEWRDFEVKAVPIMKPDGSLREWVGIITDITARKKAEEALQENEEKYRSLFEAAGDAILITKATEEGGPVIVDCNEHTFDIFGCVREEIIGKSVGEFSPSVQPDGRLSKEVISKTVKAVLEGNSQFVELTRRKLDGTLFETETTINLLEVEKETYMQAIIRDVTERKRTENELENYRKHLEVIVNERTRELEEVHVELVRKERLAALGELIATVSHEIRNPLGTIRNSVYSISVAIKKNKMDLVNRSLKLAESNITRCNRIINELLDYTRRREIKLEWTEIDSWLNEVLDEQEFPEDIECVRKLHSGIALRIDREYMRRVVSNVITNAIQALQEEDSRGNQITIEPVKNGEWLELSFIDTGPGIPDEIMEKVFEPLFSTKSFGVGLGVPIIKNIMEEHHGRVTFQSEVDKGTIVTLILPIHTLEKKR